MFKVGDEVQIKGKVVAIEIERCGLPYWVGVSNGMGYWLSEADITDKTYEKGLADAWELAKKIQYGLTRAQLENIFGTDNESRIMDMYTSEEALAKIEAYEKEKEIKVGDEVVHGIGGCETRFIVTSMSDGMIRGFDSNGITHSFTFPNRFITKTGKHIDIESLLRQIGE